MHYFLDKNVKVSKITLLNKKTIVKEGYIDLLK